MRMMQIAMATSFLASLPLAGAASPSNAAPAAASTAPSPSVQHPPEVALMDEGEKGFVYRQFPTGLRLYTFDGDRMGTSLCNAGCASAWPPLTAPLDAKPVGKWTFIERADGRRQWALMGRPIYLRYHDAPDQATGDGVDGSWHMLRHTRTRDGVPFATASR